MAVWAQWVLGVIAGVALIGAALWFALRPMLYPKPRPSGRDSRIDRGNDGWNDTVHQKDHPDH